ncbi:hypothetical protein GCM10023116_00880 [Kistimonas scapharcae]|uniref:Uncharacterized protein n=1 Tax=Kistimonas scapharcae TaxID=1036133 RepID=A0ABP8UY39_9GAMM
MEFGNRSLRRQIADVSLEKDRCIQEKNNIDRLRGLEARENRDLHDRLGQEQEFYQNELSKLNNENEALRRQMRAQSYDKREIERLNVECKKNKDMLDALGQDLDRLKLQKESINVRLEQEKMNVQERQQEPPVPA